MLGAPMAKLLEYNATLVERIDLEPALSIFKVAPDEVPAQATPGEPWFVPGQYLTIGLNREVVEGEDDPRPPSVRRPMSIASAPEEGHTVEFYIRYVSHPESDLPLTHLLWQTHTGARMYCRPVATGKFTVRDTMGDGDPRIKLCIAAGTGLAPFISIVRSRILRDPQARLDDIAILHGASYSMSLGYKDELERLVKDHGLRYAPTISRPKEEPEWTGLGGRVEALLDPDRIEHTEAALGLRAGDLRPDKAGVLICGLNGTIAQTIINLAPRGFVPDNRKLRRALAVDDTRPSSLFWEQYDSTPVIDTKDETLIASLRGQLQAALG
jgi:ferredoxin/flavodoxin---NADP+ reductase